MFKVEPPLTCATDSIRWTCLIEKCLEALDFKSPELLMQGHLGKLAKGLAPDTDSRKYLVRKIELFYEH